MAKSNPSKKTVKKVANTPKKLRVAKRQPYDMTKRGDNDFDEARRAAADLCRLAGMWCVIADEQAEAMRSSSFIALDEDDQPITDPALAEKEKVEHREAVLKSVREHWKTWEAGMGRARTAISKINDPELGQKRIEARMVMVELFRLFFPPIILMPHEKPGDQLLRPAGPLFTRRNGEPNLQRSSLERALQPLVDFSDLMVMYDPSPVSMFARAIDRDSGRTVKSICNTIKRGKTTLAKFRDAAKPKVAGRTKGQTFSFEELLRLSAGADACGDSLSATNLREIVETQKAP